MSRYVDLDGNTWDGTPITSKIQEVQTRHGYLQGITVGWLWGDNVPHIDLAEHIKQIREDAVGDYLTFVRENADKYCDDPNDGWSMVDLIELMVEWQKEEENESNNSIY